MRLELSFRPALRAFTLPASIALAEPWGTAPLSHLRWLEVRMVVDSGSARTAIAHQSARSLGVPIEKLELEEVAGATGVSPRPLLRNLHVRLPAPGMGPIRLDRVTILDPSLDSFRARAPWASHFGRAAERTLDILGMDLALHLGARINLDFGSLRGDLSW